MNKANKKSTNKLIRFPTQNYRIISFCSCVFKYVCAVCVFVTSMERSITYIACNKVQVDNVATITALPGVLGIQGEELFIFRDLGRRVIYFQNFGRKHNFWGF